MPMIDQVVGAGLRGNEVMCTACGNVISDGSSNCPVCEADLLGFASTSDEVSFDTSFDESAEMELKF